MEYNIKKLPDEPIVFVTLGADASLVSGVEEFAEALSAALDACPEQVYVISNMSEMKFSMSDVIQGANLAARQVQLFKHPKIIENVMFTPSKLLRMASQGFDTPIFGNIKLATFETREEAFAYVRGKIGTGPK